MPRLPLSTLLFVVALCFTAVPAHSQLREPVPALPAAKTPTVYEEPQLVREFQQLITPEKLAARLYYFASDFFEGRETGMPGQRMAALYLASQYRLMGLEPKGSAAEDPYSLSAYLQPFPVYGSRVDRADLVATRGRDTLMQARFGPDRQTGEAFLWAGSESLTKGGVAFVGYGIHAPELGYSDYDAASDAGLSLDDKWLLMLGDEPLRNDSLSLLPTQDGRVSEWTTRGTSKLQAAYDHARPRGLLIIGDSSPRDSLSVPEQAFRRAQNLSRSPGRLALDPPTGSRATLPIYVVSSEWANALLSGTGRDIADVQRTIDETLRPVVLDLDGVEVGSDISVAPLELQTENVVASIEGSDPALRDEVLVLSSHYDHIGINVWARGDNINNGADDDGSGTVALLGLADAFMQAKRAGYGPRRSVLFLNVTGEEKGLLGSSYYTDQQPAVPLEKTVANLNIDMIGRYDPTHPTGSKNYVYIIGSRLISEQLHQINLRADSLTGVGIEMDERFNDRNDPNRYYARSDHWNFGKNNVPFIFYFTGTHPDYHGVDDEPDRIAYERMARITRSIFATAWQVANQDDRPAVSGTGFN